jgi:hypothetical protein
MDLRSTDDIGYWLYPSQRLVRFGQSFDTVVNRLLRHDSRSSLIGAAKLRNEASGASSSRNLNPTVPNTYHTAVNTMFPASGTST